MSFLEPVNPFTLAKIGKFELETFQSVDTKLNLASSVQKSWSKASVDQRINLVLSGLKYFEVNSEEIARDISEQMGRPLHQARGEIKGFFERANFLCGVAKETLTPDELRDKDGFQRSIAHVPLGTVFVISAWNYPLLITVNSIVPALLAGNTVLLKHSSLTPKIGAHFHKAFFQLGDYEGLVQNVIVDHKTTGEIIEKSRVNHVVFTGSVSGGKKILEHTSKRFMQPALELGGKDAAYVHSDADLNYAVSSIVDGAMFNSGQSCCGIERVYVHEKHYDAFIEKAAELVKSYKLGDPKDEKIDLGPLANPKAANFMQTQVDEAVERGAKVLAGGKTVKIEKATFFEPTLVCDVDHSMDIMKEENFGPILPVMKVSDENQALQLINESDYGLTCALFTSDVKLAALMSKDIDTGTVFMNRCDYLDPALPWTGVKNSGCGSALSKYGFHTVTRKKSLHFKTDIVSN